MHKFNPADFKKLENEERYRLMPPAVLAGEMEKTAEELYKGEKNIAFADVGCGSGFFSIPLIKRAGESSGDKKIKVFALDISEEMLDMFNERLKQQISDIDTARAEVETLKSDESAIPLESGSINILLMAHVFHEIADKQAYLSEVKRVLKTGGTLFLVDWKKEDPSPVMGPPPDERVSTEEAVNALKESGFKDIAVMAAYQPSFVIKAGR